jgi:hypothetical protein
VLAQQGAVVGALGQSAGKLEAAAGEDEPIAVNLPGTNLTLYAAVSHLRSAAPSSRPARSGRSPPPA